MKILTGLENVLLDRSMKTPKEDAALLRHIRAHRTAANEENTYP